MDDICKSIKRKEKIMGTMSPMGGRPNNNGGSFSMGDRHFGINRGDGEKEKGASPQITQPYDEGALAHTTQSKESSVGVFSTGSLTPTKVVFDETNTPSVELRDLVKTTSKFSLVDDVDNPTMYTDGLVVEEQGAKPKAKLRKIKGE